ncbi:hypothetical protein F52700_5982 [Fusarium sp. NRRL 52700]|nr:hypothetical protein F52700_5982 [Fusarium sp. NRRL 52700]
MHLLYFLWFMLNLVWATPVPLDDDSSIESFFKFPDDDSFPIVDDPTFDFSDKNPEAPTKHEKRFPVPPFYLPYLGWQVTLERKRGDRLDFKKNFWIYIFPGVYDFKNPDHPQPWDIVIAPGRGGPNPLHPGVSTPGDLWYSSNSYFGRLLDVRKTPANANRTFNEFALALKRPTGYEFWLRRERDMASFHGNNKYAYFATGSDSATPTDGNIKLNFKNTTVTGSVFFSSTLAWEPVWYAANVTGTLAKQGKMWV